MFPVWFTRVIKLTLLLDTHGQDNTEDLLVRNPNHQLSSDEEEEDSDEKMTEPPTSDGELCDVESRGEHEGETLAVSNSV